MAFYRELLHYPSVHTASVPDTVAPVLAVAKEIAVVNSSATTVETGNFMVQSAGDQEIAVQNQTNTVSTPISTTSRAGSQEPLVCTNNFLDKFI